MKRVRQTIHKVVQFFKKGGTAADYVKQYKLNKKRCGRHKTQLAASEKQFIQEHLEKGWSFDVIKGSYPDNISCSMRSLYRLADRGLFLKNDLPWKGRRKARKAGFSSQPDRARRTVFKLSKWIWASWKGYHCWKKQSKCCDYIGWTPIIGNLCQTSAILISYLQIQGIQTNAD